MRLIIYKNGRLYSYSGQQRVRAHVADESVNI